MNRYHSQMYHQGRHHKSTRHRRHRRYHWRLLLATLSATYLRRLSFSRYHLHCTISFHPRNAFDLLQPTLRKASCPRPPTPSTSLRSCTSPEIWPQILRGCDHAHHLKYGGKIKKENFIVVTVSSSRFSEVSKPLKKISIHLPVPKIINPTEDLLFTFNMFFIPE